PASRALPRAEARGLPSVRLCRLPSRPRTRDPPRRRAAGHRNGAGAGSAQRWFADGSRPRAWRLVRTVTETRSVRTAASTGVAGLAEFATPSSRTPAADSPASKKRVYGFWDISAVRPQARRADGCMFSRVL